jgi:hypothetical protein
VKTVALKDPNTGLFTMMQVTGFGSISEDDRSQYGTRVSLGNVKTSLDLKETRIGSLESDKIVKDTKIVQLETDKTLKDTKIVQLESDKALKDTALAALTTRLDALENGGGSSSGSGSMSSEAVVWTNISEINLSGGGTVVSGGSVQVNAGGTIEKISGSNGYNAGASSVQAIGGNSDGYVQFQLARAPVRIGLTYSDVDFTDITPFRLVLNYNGSAWVNPTQALAAGSVSVGDFLRIRHYAATNTIDFQKRQAVGDGQDYVTFYTHPTLTNGSDLYVDTSLFNIGSRFNDVTIVR